MTLRDKPITLECLRRFPPDPWPGGEDGYYAFHLDLMGARVGRGVECDRFSTQGRFRHIMRDNRFRLVPKVIETPKGDDPVRTDRRNLSYLRRCSR